MVDAIGSRVQQQVEALRGLVAGLDPDAVPLPEAAELWADFDRLVRLAEAARLLLARRVEDSPAWKTAGCRSAAEYLARVGAGSVRGARELLRASRRVPALPRIDQALRSGQLVVTRAELIADAATVDPSREAELVDLAGRLSLVELARECGRVKAAADPDPDETYRRIHANRRLRTRVDGEGAWCLSGRGTVDVGALVEHALGPLIDEIYDHARAEDRHVHRDAYAFDAFVELIHRYLDHEDVAPTDGPDTAPEPDPVVDDASADLDEPSGDEADTAGVAEPIAGDSPVGPGHHPPDTDPAAAVGPPSPADGGAAAGGDRPSEASRPATADGRVAPALNRWQRRRLDRVRRRSRSNPRYLGLIRIDYSALVRGQVLGDELCEISGLGPIPVRVARELLGDALLKIVITKGVGVANVTHLGRAPTVAQRMALLWQSPLCANEACGHSLVQLDHREPWARTRHTILGELDPLCPHCHRLKTFHGWALVDGIGRRAFVPPDDPRHPTYTERQRQAA